MKIVVAGLGSIGRRHLRNLRSLGETDILLLRSYAGTIEDDDLVAGLPVVTSIHDALENKPQAIIIANPTSLHIPFAIPAARAGCAILMEKPISDDLAKVTELQTTVNETGARILVGFQYRFHPGLKQVKTWLDNKEIGRVISISSYWGDYLPDWHPWEDYRQSYAARSDLGGGVVKTLCHPIDYLRWLFGDATVCGAVVGKFSDLDLAVEDHADVLLSFENNVKGTLHLDYYRKPGIHRLEILGANGMIDWTNDTGICRCYRQSTGQWETFVPDGQFERNTLFIDEMRHFLAVASGVEQPICTLGDGIQTQKLIDEILTHAKYI